MIHSADICTTKDALLKAKRAIDQAIDLIDKFDQATDELERIVETNNPATPWPDSWSLW